MPELPEVEIVREQLEKFLVGHKIEDVRVNYKNFEGNKKNLIGGKVVKIRRFGKVISIDLDNGFSIVVHIKLTGQLIYTGPKIKASRKLSNKIIGGVPGAHTHVVFSLDNPSLRKASKGQGGKLFYNDVRKFGWLKIVKTDDVEKISFIKKLGPEPHVVKNSAGQVLTEKYFRELLLSTRRNIKTLLLDQSKLAGVGNIYANDALWLAKILPSRPANSLSLDEQKKLFNAIKAVLKKGLKMGGASELAYVHPDGTEGEYQKHFLVYGKEGQVCARPACRSYVAKGYADGAQAGVRIKKIKLGGRGTNYCPNCQK